MSPVVPAESNAQNRSEVAEREGEPAAAAAVFGARIELARHFAELLSDSGVERGLVGPREASRIWSRHLLNCAVVAELIREDARVVDVGSGAGLPGLALAIRRPDLTVDLVEPLLRRVRFLEEVVAALALGGQVRVHRGRAEDAEIRSVVGNAAVVTARAVAPLDRLVRWCLPLLAPDGRLLLMKGSTAGEEVQEHRRALARAGAGTVQVLPCGVGLVEPAVNVVSVERRSTRDQPRGVR